MSVLKEAIEFYKERKKFEKERKQLITADTNFSLLETFIQKVNTNPNLVVNITLANGTKIELATYVKKVRRDFQMINGVDDTFDFK